MTDRQPDYNKVIGQYQQWLANRDLDIALLSEKVSYLETENAEVPQLRSAVAGLHARLSELEGTNDLVVQTPPIDAQEDEELRTGLRN